MSSEYRSLFLLVEGRDDARFCREVLIPIFRRTFHDVRTWEYSQKKSSKTVDFIRNIGYMNAEYILFADIDEHPCVTATKEAIVDQYSRLDWGQIVVVRREIEAWYLAGLDDESSRNLRLNRVTDVDSVTKEQFDRLVGGREQHSRTMVNILERYDVEVARRRSPSFAYFWQKHVE